MTSLTPDDIERMRAIITATAEYEQAERKQITLADYERLHALAQAIWLYTETYTLPGSGEQRRSFRYGGIDYVIHADDFGIGGAIAQLCDYLDSVAPD